MKEIKVYNAIHQLKERGFKKDSVAKQLNINWRTVDRYWNMTVAEYESQSQAMKRASQLDDYKTQILLWLRKYPTMTSAQVCDWLKEHYKVAFKERTVSRYVKALRDEYGLKETTSPRDYEAVPELPMGQQIQSFYLPDCPQGQHHYLQQQPLFCSPWHLQQPAGGTVGNQRRCVVHPDAFW